MKCIKYFKTLSLGIAAVVAFGLGGCTSDFENKNTNPDNATGGMLETDNLTTGSAFHQMTRNMIPTFQPEGSGLKEYGSNNYQAIQDLAGNIFAGYTGATNSSFTSNNLYNLDANTWHDQPFNDGFTRCISAWKGLDKQRKEFPEIVAMGDIVKVALLCRLTDMYGPIPYTTITGTGVQNSYDSQETVYKGLLGELAAAIDLLTTFYQAQPSAKLLAKYDNVYSGEVEKWIKFANTLRLRMAMRTVYVNPSLARTEAEAAVANPVGVMTAAGDIARINKPAAGTWETPLFIIQHNFNDSRIGATIEAYMNGYEDPRRSLYFTTASDSKYHGVRNGIALNSNYASSALLSKINTTNTDPIMWMTPAEAYFLRAEGALRGWNMGDTAKNLYENGIRTSFSTVGASGVDTYLANSTLTPAAFEDMVVASNKAAAPSTITIAWNDSDAFEKSLERIITQKYIAMFPEGQEAWSEFRRTGYPKIFKVVKNNSGGKIDTDIQIRRLNYPSTEYQTNREAINAATATLVSESKTSAGSGDNGGTKLWWDKK